MFFRLLFSLIQLSSATGCDWRLGSAQASGEERLRRLLSIVEPWRHADERSGFNFYARVRDGNIYLTSKDLKVIADHGSARFLPGLKGLLRAIDFTLKDDPLRGNLFFFQISTAGGDLRF